MGHRRLCVDSWELVAWLRWACGSLGSRAATYRRLDCQRSGFHRLRPGAQLRLAHRRPDAQGVGAALVFATAPALVTLAVSAEARGRALGIYQMRNAAGYAIGPLIGGILIDNLGWRATFMFRVAPAAMLAGLAAVKFRCARRRAGTRLRPFWRVVLSGERRGMLAHSKPERRLGMVIATGLYSRCDFDRWLRRSFSS